MPSPYYTPVDPGYGRIGAAIGGGIASGSNNFVRMQELRRAQEEEEIERQEREAQQLRAQQIQDVQLGRQGIQKGVAPTPIQNAMSAWGPAGAAGAAAAPLLQTQDAGGGYTYTPYLDRDRMDQVQSEQSRIRAALLQDQREDDRLRIQAGLDPLHNPDLAPVAAATRAENERRAATANRPDIGEQRFAEEQAVARAASEIAESLLPTGVPITDAIRPNITAQAIGKAKLYGIRDPGAIVYRVMTDYGSRGSQSSTQSPARQGAKLVLTLKGKFDKSVGLAGRFRTAKTPEQKEAILTQWLAGDGRAELIALARANGLDEAALGTEFIDIMVPE